jgi:hypothetical protein
MKQIIRERIAKAKRRSSDPNAPSSLRKGSGPLCRYHRMSKKQRSGPRQLPRPVPGMCPECAEGWLQIAKIFLGKEKVEKFLKGGCE